MYTMMCIYQVFLHVTEIVNFKVNVLLTSYSIVNLLALTCYQMYRNEDPPLTNIAAFEFPSTDLQ